MSLLGSPSGLGQAWLILVCDWLVGRRLAGPGYVHSHVWW